MPEPGKVAREAQLDAVVQVLLQALENGEHHGGLLRALRVQGRSRGRDLELRFPGGAAARRVELRARIRTGGAFRARPRHSWLRRIGLGELAVRGQPPQAVREAAARLVSERRALEVSARDGQVLLVLPWSVQDEADPLLAGLEELQRIALALEGVGLQVEMSQEGGCPVCKATLEPSGPRARCEACGTGYHPSCFEKNRGCAVYGCGNQSARATAPEVEELKGA